MAHHPFPQTRWTLVLRAKDGERQDAFAALEDLSLAYWKPVYAYLRGKGHLHEQAQWRIAHGNERESVPPRPQL